MNDTQNHTRFLPCLELIIKTYPNPTTFTSLSKFTPNSFCTLLRKAKHHHVDILGLPFPSDIVFKFTDTTVIAGPKCAKIEPITPELSSKHQKVSRPLDLTEFTSLCLLLDRDLLTEVYEVPGEPPADRQIYPNVELIQNTDHYLLL
jgi:hypothetical protein